MENLQGHEMGKEDRKSRQQGKQHRANEFFHRASEAMGLPYDAGRNVSQAILRNIIRRITREEARHLIAQLPSGLQDECCSFIEGPMKSIDAAKVKRDIINASGIDGVDPAGCARVFWKFLGTWLNEPENKGETVDVLGQLPSDLKELFTYGIKH